MRALVMGGGGFIGRHICDRLRSAGHAVTVFDRVRHPELPSLVGDFQDPAQLQAAVHGMDWVFHLVWTTLPRSSNDNMQRDLETNVGSTLRLLDACVRAGVRKVVFSSSGGTVYGAAAAQQFAEDYCGHPICSYGITKLTVEKYLHLYRHLHGLDFTVLRVSNPYGEGQNPFGEQGAVGIFLGRICRQEPITLFGDGQAIRDYIYIRDVADAFLAAAAVANPPHRVFNIGSGEGVSLGELLQVVQEVTGRQAIIEHVPGRAVDVPRVVLDVSRARRELGWQPTTPLRQGIERTWAWVQQVAERPRPKSEAA
jgi:UDP-glucose 4-epimerase